MNLEPFFESAALRGRQLRVLPRLLGSDRYAVGHHVPLPGLRCARSATSTLKFLRSPLRLRNCVTGRPDSKGRWRR